MQVPSLFELFTVVNNNFCTIFSCYIIEKVDLILFDAIIFTHIIFNSNQAQTYLVKRPTFRLGQNYAIFFISARNDTSLKLLFCVYLILQTKFPLFYNFTSSYCSKNCARSFLDAAFSHSFSANVSKPGLLADSLTNSKYLATV